MALFILALPKILKDEGGFQADPNDNANYCDGKLIGTNRGISAIGYKGYYGKCPTVEQMRALTSEQAGAIFKRNYWDKINGDKINNFSVAQLMMQYIIGSGASQLSDIKDIANKVGGKNVLVSNDLAITDADANFINGLNQQVFWEALKSWRLEFYKRLVAQKPSLQKFYNGWVNRLNSYVYSNDEKKK